MYNECLDPTTPHTPDNLDLNPDNELANTSFEHLSRGPAKSGILKCTNADQLEIGSCYF